MDMVGVWRLMMVDMVDDGGYGRGGDRLILS